MVGVAIMQDMKQCDTCAQWFNPDQIGDYDGWVLCDACAAIAWECADE